MKFCAGDFSLDDSEQLGRPAETLDSNQTEALIQNNQCYTTWEIADILKIPKSIKFLVKMKKLVFYFMEKHERTFWPTQQMCSGFGHQLKLHRSDKGPEASHPSPGEASVLGLRLMRKESLGQQPRT